ncbi:MAG: hypothetical protein JWO53_1382 [Chlamydiia bacterium]|nr:hypothetical protein [Chlamydiia bacterium]
MAYAIHPVSIEEYFQDIYSNNPAFARRFKKITINDTEPDETLEILSTTYL